ncbi:hypothetical protein BH24CHL4_BH24CHL4_26990 [soil metagenome]
MVDLRTDASSRRMIPTTIIYPSSYNEQMIELDSLSPDHISLLPVKLQWALVHYWRDCGEFERAWTLVERMAERSDETSTLRNEQYRLALAQGDAGAALRYANRRTLIAPSPSAEIEVGRAELAQGNLEVASRIAIQMDAEHPAMLSALSFVADVLAAMDDLDAADERYRGLLEFNRRSPAALLGRARVAIARGDARGALALLVQLTAEPVRLNLAQTREAAGHFETLGQHGPAGALREQADSVILATGEQLRQDISARLRDLPALVIEDEPAIELAMIQDGQFEPEIDPSVLETLRATFGFPALRAGQAKVIANVLSGQDTLAIMPTGSGKSLTFQLPALLLPGVTLVISPLIALMKDQVESLPSKLRDRTRLINSTLSHEEMRSALAELKAGELRLVYVAPERLRDRSFLQALQSASVSLVVVDEAHCISLWGQDFRPDYLFIPRAVAEMGQPPVLAVTATATPAMAEQIATGLGRKMDLARLSLFRPNLRYEVRPAGNREQKIREVLAICREERGSGIVYVSSRKDTESIAALLRDNGVGAIAYHAGLDPDDRAASQDRFMSGQSRVVVATIAFGMGVDKANVRFIIHFNPPSSLEAYAQESGRAGRDGQIARCVLLSAKNDETRLRQFARFDALNKDDLRVVYTNLKRFAAGRWALLDRFNAGNLSGGDEDLNSRVALGLLDQAGLVSRHPDVPVTLNLRWNPDDARLWEADPDWRRFVEWLGPAAERGATTVNVAEACQALGMAPLDLDRLLATQSGVRVHEGPRVVCIELLAAGTDAPQRVDSLLAEVERLSDRRIRQVVTYAQRQQCRHVMLAAQFGEHLEPCGTSCDVCTGKVRVDDRQLSKDGKKRIAEVDDALKVLQAVRTLPFPMGRTGLVRLLLGSAESRVQKDRSPSFGALAEFSVSSAGRLVDRLTEQGYLLRDTDHEYNLISLTEKGRTVTAGDLASEFVARGRRGGQERSGSGPDAARLAPDEQQLYDRLAEWRLQIASRDQTAPFIIAHNTMLEAVAAAKPETLAQLSNLPGFGPVKCEKYGEEILEMVKEDIAPS